MKREKLFKIALGILSIAYFFEFIIAILWHLIEAFNMAGLPMVRIDLGSDIIYTENIYTVIGGISKVTLTIITIIFVVLIAREFNDKILSRFSLFYLIGAGFTIILPLFQSIPLNGVFFTYDEMFAMDIYISLNERIFLLKLIFHLIGGTLLLLSWNRYTKLVKNNKKARNSGRTIQISYYIVNLVNFVSLLFLILHFYEIRTGQSVPNVLFDPISLVFLFQPIIVPFLTGIGFAVITFSPPLEKMISNGEVILTKSSPRNEERRKQRREKREQVKLRKEKDQKSEDEYQDFKEGMLRKKVEFAEVTGTKLKIKCPFCGSFNDPSPIFNKCYMCGADLSKISEELSNQKGIVKSEWNELSTTQLKKFDTVWHGFANWFVFMGLIKIIFFFFEWLSARWDMLTYDGFFFILVEECVTIFMLIILLCINAKLTMILKSKRFYLYFSVITLYILGKTGAELLYYIGYALHYGFYTLEGILITYFWLIIAVDVLFIVSMALLGIYAAKDLQSRKWDKRQVIYGAIFLIGAVLISYVAWVLDIFFFGVIPNWLFIGIYILEVVIFVWGCVKVGILGLGQVKIWHLPKNI